MLQFVNGTQKASHRKNILPTVKIKYYNVMIDDRNVFDQLVVY